ncbi:UNVERIFIED_CONTAM: hypothetical protein PYX00_005551 [Menopon gallinae]|uniref:Uncharacterized protein n=1 Tax=Menopon gallinae TaxID=328185 RepID=A0AAW2HRV8_9NEOP
MSVSELRSNSAKKVKSAGSECCVPWGIHNLFLYGYTVIYGVCAVCNRRRTEEVRIRISVSDFHNFSHQVEINTGQLNQARRVP